MQNSKTISNEVKLIRIASLLGFILYPVFGLALGWLVGEGADDPVNERLIVGSLAIAIFATTFTDKLVEHLSKLVYATIYIATAHVFWLALRNDLSSYYQIGFIAMVAALNPYFKTIKDLSFYMIFLVLLMFVGLSISYNAEQVFFYLALFTVASMAFLALDIRRRIMDKLEKSRLLVSNRNRDIKSILNNIHQGIMPIKLSAGELTVDEDYSHFLTVLVGRDDLNGKDPFEVLFGRTDLCAEQLALVRTVLVTCIGSDPLQWEVNDHVLPRQASLKMSEANFDIELDWDPVLNHAGDEIDKILVTIRDVTALNKAQKESQKKEKDMVILAKILAVEPASFHSFADVGASYISSAMSLIEEYSREYSNEKLAIAFRELHTLKGLARCYSFDDISEKTHDVEDVLKSLINAVEQADRNRYLEAIDLEVHTLDEIFNRYLWVNEHILKRSWTQEIRVEMNYLKTKVSEIKACLEREGLINMDTGLRLASDLEAIYSSKLSSIVKDELRSIGNLAKDLGKVEPVVNIYDDDCTVSEEIKEPIKAAFIHIIRNSLDHGLESAEERIKKGKSERGLIEVRVRQTETNSFDIVIKDDGRGLNIGRIKQVGVEKKLITEKESCINKIANLIFTSEFSTNRKASQISGRGIGMDAVMSKLLEVGILVELELGELTSDNFLPFAIHLKCPSQTLRLSA